LLLQLRVGRLVTVAHFAVAIAAHVLRLRSLHNHLRHCVGKGIEGEEVRARGRGAQA